jgi:type I site-specific restriction-modification system R (restriction) subunit
VIVDQIGELAGRRFAVIVDEAHSSQSGESSRSLKTVLAADSLEAAAAEEEGAPTPEDEIEDRVLQAVQRRGRLPNVSFFAFTATPSRSDAARELLLGSPVNVTARRNDPSGFAFLDFRVSGYLLDP